MRIEVDRNVYFFSQVETADKMGSRRDQEAIKQCLGAVKEKQVWFVCLMFHLEC